MIKGLIIGKFMPPHKGHLGLIRFASKRCDFLIVAICSRPRQEIDPKLRYAWMKKLTASMVGVRVVQIKADLPQDKRSTYKASRPWAEYCTRRFGKIDKIFSSEKYGKYMAYYMNSEYVDYDLKRKRYPVSGTLIRAHPFRYWKYIPEVVRPYFVKRICVYGPESTGKTTLARDLAAYYKTRWVPEYAREVIAKKGNRFNYENLDLFASGQVRRLNNTLKDANKIVFSDTDPITTLIYSRHYFGKVSNVVRSHADQKNFDMYLFCDIDIPWKKDPQRDLGERREEFKKIFERELEKRRISYGMVRGLGAQRLENAVELVNGSYRNLAYT